MNKAVAILLGAVLLCAAGCSERRVETSTMAPPVGGEARPPTAQTPRPYINDVTDPSRQPSSNGGIGY